MSNRIKPLASGLEALAQKRYAEAIELLETFCQLSQINRDYWQAQMSLVQAYIGAGQNQRAIALCEKLLASKNLEVRAWAHNFITKLVPPVLTSVAAPQDSTKNTVGTNFGIKLKTLDELKQFYQQYLLADLKEFEKKRKAVVNQIAAVGITLSIVVLALFLFFPYGWLNFSTTRAANFSFAIIFLFLLAFVGCMYAWVVFYSSSTETYVNGFKSKIIQQIINFIDEKQILKYSQSDSAEMTLAAFEHSQIFSGAIAPSKITQDDCISGTLGETDIFFSEVCAEIEIEHNWINYFNISQNLFSRRTFDIPIYISVFVLIIAVFKGIPYIIRRMIKGQRIDYYHFEEEIIKNEVTRKAVFKGLFFQADFHKSFQSKTIVLPAVLDYKIQVLNRHRGEVIKLEDPEFNHLFVVYSEDQVAARYVLTTNLMAKLVRFKKKAKRNIYVSFVDSKIYIAVEYAEDLFEPLLFKTMLGFAPVREYFEILKLMLGIVEDLNLNRRIWNG